MALTMLLPDGTRVHCSRTEHADLFMASICGIGCTGLILSIQMRVEPAFNLREHQETVPFERMVDSVDALVHSAEHVRFWWFPQADAVRLSLADRTSEVRRFGSRVANSLLSHRPRLAPQARAKQLAVGLADRLPRRPVPAHARPLPPRVQHLDRSAMRLAHARAVRRGRPQLEDL